MPRQWEAVPPCLRCPICRSDFALDGHSLRCERRHTFDVSREGYVNLLVSRGRLAPTVGDSRPMLRSRQAFLAGDHYAPLSHAIGSAVREHVARRDATERDYTVVDVGCGTGYYLDTMRDFLRAAGDGQGYWTCGLDVSREATSLAARAYPESYFVVADVTRAVPLADASVDVALNVFSPRNAAEFARIIHPGGLLLVMIPTERHLKSLRADLPMLGIEANKPEHVRQQLEESFFVAQGETLTYELDLSGRDVVALVEMTPAHRRLTELDRERLAVVGPRHAEVSVEILQFRRSR